MHSRQILLNKVSLVKIQLAESSGDANAIELAKVRFKDLDHSEVTFKQIKKKPGTHGQFSGVIELTQRDGHTFNQNWNAADAVNFFKTTKHVTVATVESFKDIIKPGLYFVSDVNEMVILLRDEMGLDETLGLLGYDFEQGELELIERRLELNSPIVMGSLPVRRIFKKADGTYSDGTRLEVTLTGGSGSVLPGNPDLQAMLTVKYLPKAKTTQLKEGTKVLKDGSKDVTITLLGTNRPVITGELVNGQFSVPLNLSDLVGKELSFLVTVGLADDVRTQEYSVQYVAENWSFQPITEPKYTRVGYPLELSGVLSSDLGNEPWGEFKTTITHPDGSTEVQELAQTGAVNVSTTPLTDGQLNIDFKCGEGGDNTVNVNYDIKGPVTVDELEFGDVIVTSGLLTPGQLVELSSELKTNDGLTLTDADVVVIVDDKAVKTIQPDSDGKLATTFEVINDDLEDKTVDVKLVSDSKSSQIVEITIKGDTQIPNRIDVLEDAGYVGVNSDLTFLVYDDKDRQITDAEGTYRIGDGDVKPLLVDNGKFIANMGDGIGSDSTVTVDVTAGSLTKTLIWEWLSHVIQFGVPEFVSGDDTFTVGESVEWSGDVVTTTGAPLDGSVIRLMEGETLLSTGVVTGGRYAGEFIPDVAKDYQLSFELDLYGITYVSDIIQLSVAETDPS